MLGFIVYCGLIHDPKNDWLCSIGNSEFFCDNHKVEIYRAFMIFAAVLLAIQGMSEDMIMSTIGWSSRASLLRYLKVPVAVLSSFQNYEEAVNFIQR